MGDKRTDPGHYYPGGRVRAKSGTAPQELIVQWSDVQGKPQIAPLPDRYKDSDVKGKINEIASKFATIIVVALIGWTACADITVQKKRKDQIYNDEQVVVDVLGDGVGINTNAVIDIANATIATNPVVAAKLYGPAVTPTNTAEAAGKAADAKLTGIALTNRYTKAETDAKLAPITAQIAALQDGKRDKTDLDIRTVVPRYDLVDDASSCSDSAFTAEAWKTISKEGDIYHIGSFPDVYHPGTTWSEMYSGWKTGDYVFFDMVASGAISDGHTLKFHVQSEEEVVDHLAKESQLAQKRDLTDNTCHKTEFTEWDHSDAPAGVTFNSHPQPSSYGAGGGTWVSDDQEYGYQWVCNEDISDDSVHQANFIEIDGGGVPTGRSFAATRSAVCTINKTFTTQDYVDGKVSSAVSTNNPEFVSAVRNTPTSGMSDDMPTDWGTYGTFGAALAALAAFVKWAKAKIVAVIGDDGKPTDTFATDLLGKPVAISAVNDLIAAKLPYPMVAYNATDGLKDRMINVVGAGVSSLIVPSDTKDTLIRLTAESAVTSITFALTGAKHYGDALPTAAGDYLITVTRIEGIASGETAGYFVRTIEMKDAQ